MTITQDKNLELMAQMFDNLNAKSSIEEIAKYIAEMVKVIAQLKNLNEKEVENLRAMFLEAISEVKDTNSEQFSSLKARIMSDFEKELSNLEKKTDKTLQKIEDKVATLLPGKDADEEKIVTEVLSKIPPAKEIVLDTPEQVRDKLETLHDEERLDVSAIKGIDQIVEDLKGSGKTVRIGGGRGVHLWVNGIKKGVAQFIDIIPGSNVTISDSLVNGLHSITISSSGGAGFTQLSATEIPDGSRTTFTFAAAAAKPSFLVVDNVWMKPVTALGTVNWTWLGTVATLAIPAVDDIWGVA